MNRRRKTIGAIVLAGLLILWGRPVLPTDTTEDLLKRLEILSAIIQEQQKEVERFG